MDSNDSTTDHESPEDRAGIISRLFFCWMQSLVSKGCRQPLQQSDLYPLSRGTACSPLADLFEQTYYSLKNCDGGGWFLQRWKWLGAFFAMAKSVGWRYWTYGGLVELIRFAFSIGQVYALRAIIERVSRVADGEEAGGSLWYYLLVALGMFLAALAQGICMHALFYHGVRSGLKAQTSITATVYRKALSLSLPSITKVTHGQVGNLLISDAERIFEFLVYWHFTWLTAFEVVIIGVLLFIDLGWSALFGILIIFIMLALEFILSLLVVRSRKRAVLHADARVQIMGEVLQGMHAVKLNAWEPHFHDVVEDKRHREVRHILAANINTAVPRDLFYVSPMFSSVATFISLTLLFGNSLTPALTFSALGLFNVLRLVLIILPVGARNAGEAMVALKRVDSFLSLSELPMGAAREITCDIEEREGSSFHTAGGNELDHEPEFPTLRASIINGDFAWSPESEEGQLVDKTNSTSNNCGRNCSRTNHEVENVLRKDRKGGKMVTSSIPALRDMSGAPMDARLDRDGLVLQKINIQVRDGDLICVVGAVGSGKTSLLLAILGELHLVCGRRHTFGSVAYCAQQPWIVNGTVRENVTVFRKRNEPIDKKFYNRIIDACCFRDDLDTLPAGDETEIGERGVNLSGGQKARLALCRAMYSDSGLFLLDDPLSAVDTIVGKQLKERVLGSRGMLSNKSRVVVTHQLQLLPESSYIIVLSQGKCIASGTYDELVRNGLNLVSLGLLSNDKMDEQELQWDQKESTSGIDLPRQGMTYEEIEENNDPVGNSQVLSSTEESTVLESFMVSSGRRGEQRKSEDNAEPETARGQLVTKEDRRIGRVAWPVYRKYARAAGGVCALLLVAALYIISQSVRQIADWWLAEWSTDSREHIKNDGFSIGNRFYGLIFAGLALGTGVLFALRAFLSQKRAAAASRHLHDLLLKRILHAAPIFFESNPVGRILNRFSKDIDQMDNLLPIAAQDFFNAAIMSLGQLAMIIWILPWFLLAVAPMAVFFWLYQRWFLLSSRELKRLDGISKSPVYAQYTETMAGLTTVRAFRAQQRFRRLFEKRVDSNQQAVILFWATNRWLGTRLDVLASFVVFLTSAIIVGISGKVSPGLAGVALSQSLMLTGFFQWTVRLMAECENFFTSVERITAMTAEAPVEAPSIIPENRPNPSWPSEGVVEFDKVVLRYRSHLEPALKGVSFCLKPFERIGICGRTGSGKSSLFVALFRMVELSEGRILIDGVDIGKIGLRDLRLRLAIVPQDPVLFNTTIRQNIDPLGKHSDAELWETLDRVHMRQAVIGGGCEAEGAGNGNSALLNTEAKVEAGLDLMVSEGGSNFSSGERQLLSLARAIVSGVRVVALDEATASVDRKTDALIQHTVRSHLRNCTVITIAHRLDTIMDCDRILVMKSGEAVEMDTPERLLRKKDGYFAQLVNDARRIGKRKFEEKIEQGCRTRRD